MEQGTSERKIMDLNFTTLHTIRASTDPEWIGSQYNPGAPELHGAIAGNRHSPASTLALLAESDNALVRLLVARNPSSRELTLRGLLDDGSRAVATQAEVTLDG
jgi:hypothetical protein